MKTRRPTQLQLNRRRVWKAQTEILRQAQAAGEKWTEGLEPVVRPEKGKGKR